MIHYSMGPFQDQKSIKLTHDINTCKTKYKEDLLDTLIYNGQLCCEVHFCCSLDENVFLLHDGKAAHNFPQLFGLPARWHSL